MAYKLVVKQEAVEDTASIYKWYEDQLSGLGHEFESALDAVYEYLEEYPYHYQVQYKDYRKGWLGRFPYYVAYEIDDEQNTVTVYGVFGMRESTTKIKQRVKQAT